ncbi:MAG: flagellar basal body rod C-terminal domain-containing protein [Desulfatiglans sp.]|jgi:flagellar basal-body rod protein FlgC|nr:flagellar basal body rod C-terminal domain-containing protein [Thermodesulfobacteriota bacterium]MEE4353634.1 flagellar basal body rod C-terminal domain-containing protein [Desulfatiglans sp.]
MVSTISSSLSALSAFGKKMSVAANNIANVNTDGFKKSRAILREGPYGGVEVTINRIDTPGLPTMEEGSVPATATERSNVDLTEEIPQMMIAKRAYQANTQTIKAHNEMVGSLIDIFR